MDKKTLKGRGQQEKARLKPGLRATVDFFACDEANHSLYKRPRVLIADAVATGSALAYLSSVIDAFECPMRLCESPRVDSVGNGVRCKTVPEVVEGDGVLVQDTMELQGLCQGPPSVVDPGRFQEGAVRKAEDKQFVAELNAQIRAFRTSCRPSRFARSFIRSFGQLGIARRLLMLLGPFDIELVICVPNRGLDSDR